MTRQFGVKDIKIRDVSFEKDYKIEVLLNNGHKVIYNMKPKLETARFLELRNMGLYKKGIVKKGKSIYWNVNTELTLAEIMMGITNTHI